MTNFIFISIWRELFSTKMDQEFCCRTERCGLDECFTVITHENEVSLFYINEKRLKVQGACRIVNLRQV